MSRRILMILPEFYPDDIRVSKEIRSLQAAGFDIDLVCYRKKKQSLEENISGIHIYRVNGANSFYIKGITDIISSFFFLNPFFYIKLRELQKRKEYALVHVHDLPLFKTAYKAFSNSPIILDLHENYPEALKVWFQWKKNPLIRLKNKIFFGFERWSSFEKKCLRKATKVITVVEEMTERTLRQDQLLQESKFEVVSNMEESTFLEQKVNQDVYKDFNNKFIVSYTGNVGPHRGVDTLIESAKYLKDLMDLQILIIGNVSTETRKFLSDIVKENQLNNVEICGYRPFSLFYSYMRLSAVNVIPHKKNGHTDNTIPHKLFQAMMCKRPVLVSDCAPLKRIVSSANAGLTFEAGNASHLAEQIRRLHDDNLLCEKFGDNGYNATVTGRLNWKYEGEKLVSVYKSLVR
ncbi:MAG: glycosyltransferase family 4 protein [Bacteroidota bacterium]